ncbi:uncharacterized protein GIQ15_02218 [Arthroderma uncinatum]|uniref:uncharacterized protein n=1 Tax=Arthroderma uncinatum TaxID=74035 RepID=UPI00144AD99F|nr:uncharacterized protein GIQ15_02218 [Arthroderma uncinatum]KAF3482894.1 hypothetical protein GIQ15_02218 [Arthroderma uncinatum]
MPLTVLNGPDVRSLLLSLTRQEVREIQDKVASVLREYSRGAQDELGQVQQHMVIRQQDGLDSILMPLHSGGDAGFEVMNVLEGSGQQRRQSQPASIPSPRRTSNPGDNQGSIASVPPEIESSPSVPSQRTIEEHPSTANFDKTANTESARDFRSGYLTISDSFGMPAALINTQDVIPFRSALCSSLVFARREKVEAITIFGAGRVAFWHIRLALLLRGSQIKKVDIFNRSFDRASKLLRDIYSPEQMQWRSGVKFAAVSPSFIDYDRDLKHSVTNADVIFCCTSSKEPLFPADYLIMPPTSQKGQLISAVGSCRPDTAELDPLLLKHATEGHRHYRGGTVVVDTLDSCLQQAGELVQAGLDPLRLVEVGELLMVNDFAQRGKSPDEKLLDWIQDGDVIYKSVGLGMLDLVLGKEIWHRAMQKGIGITVPQL